MTQQEITLPPMEQVPISQLKADGQNPNKMDRQGLDRLKRSIQQYGFIVPIITNKDLLIADGEQRWIAANELAMKEVSVIRLPVEDVDRRLLRQVLNKLRGEHELLLDAEEFDKIISAGREDDLKFLLDLNDSKLERYLRELHPPQDEDYKIPEIEKVTTSIRRGDVIALGKHRLMCGDSLLAEEVNMLCPSKVKLVFTDPPYNVQMGTIKHPKFKQRPIENDDMTDEEYSQFCEAFANQMAEKCEGDIYVCHAPLKDGHILQSQLLKRGFHWASTIIWAKQAFTLGRGKYHSQYEPIFYGWLNTSSFNGQRDLSNLWQIDRPTNSESHPTMKPFALVMKAMMSSSEPNDSVLDLFGGSGTTLIVSEDLGRVCYMMEIDPRYCEIIAQRWEKYTGQKRKLLESGKNDVR